MVNGDNVFTRYCIKNVKTKLNEKKKKTSNLNKIVAVVRPLSLSLAGQ